jgi:hypothetical protein
MIDKAKLRELAERFGQKCLEDADDYTLTWDEMHEVERALRSACDSLDVVEVNRDSWRDAYWRACKTLGRLAWNGGDIMAP